jgi:hypothetical protein
MGDEKNENANAAFRLVVEYFGFTPKDLDQID